ncbi:histidine kinase [Winogradskya consettensis]|uniref:histidine kinase n=1 Tax=Winogradskya consettensis TaxID=113560 RepID=A0A919SNT4_9ACTN|nr:histidine kinase [Actinoplanes consettensis]GIM75817.1 two-component sensor histidine kinase [Actinoplanes consettensis]
MRQRGQVWVAAGVTLVGVPAGLALTGGNVDSAITGALAVFLAGVVLAVRRWPVSALLVSVWAVLAFRAADLVGAGWVWPATAAFVGAMVDGRQRWAIAVGALALWWGFVWDYFVQMNTFEFAVGRVGAEALWLAAVLAVTHAYLSTRRWQEEVAARLRQSLTEQELDARRRRAEERVDVARDLHDAVSHTLAVVGVHLNVALDAFDDEPEEARDAVRLAQDVRGRAMTDLKALVDVLRRDPGTSEPAYGLESLEGLTGQVSAAGVRVRLVEVGERADVPAPVATAVHRVVQESLTNTVRHAGAEEATVTLHYAPESVTVEIVDDGGGGLTGSEGHGIMGMRERVAALGGTLVAGDGPDGGFRVRASIPVTV